MVLCGKSSVPFCRVGGLLPYITSELLILFSDTYCLTCRALLGGELGARCFEPLRGFSCWVCKYRLHGLLPSVGGKSSTSLWSVLAFHWLDKRCQAMYPSLILIIVNKEHSIVNTFGFSTPVPRSNLNGEGHANGAEHRSAITVSPNPPGTVDSEH